MNRQNIFLNEREIRVLYSIVQEYTHSRKPVSSQRILDITDLECSSATIRNVMKELEEKDLITQPHTSAGRVPTDQGYRFFVQCLEKLPFEAPEERGIASLSSLKVGNIQNLLSNFSGFLSRWLKGLAIVEKPFIEKLRIKKVTIYPVFQQYWVVVFITNMGLAEDFVVFFEEELPAREMEDFLTEKLNGIALGDVKELMSFLNLPDYSWYDSQLEHLFLFLQSVLKQSVSQRFFKKGYEELLQDDMVDHQQLQNIVTLVEDEAKLMELLDQLPWDQKTGVQIGTETGRSELKEMTLFFSRYEAGESPLGRLVLITHKANDYLGNLRGMQYISNRITEYMTRMSTLSQKED